VDCNWHQVEGYRDALILEIRRSGVPFDVAIESTEQGRMIEVRTPDIASLPDGFGSPVPADAYTIIETDVLPREE